MPKKQDKEERKPGEPLKDIQQELFCQIYAGAGENFGNGVWSYVLAYKINLPFIAYSQLSKEQKKLYCNAKSKAAQILTKVNIKTRCNEILDSHIKHEVVDRETAWTIIQRKELGPKVAAIREYNDVNQRIIEKHEHTIFEGKSDDKVDRLRDAAFEELIRRRLEKICDGRRARKKEKKGNVKG